MVHPARHHVTATNRPCHGEKAGAGVVEFRGAGLTVGSVDVGSACDEHLAVIEKRCRVPPETWHIQVPSGDKLFRRRVVQFGGIIIAWGASPNEKNLAVIQQCRSMTQSRHGHIARRAKCSGWGIVELGGCGRDRAGGDSPGNQYRTVLQQR